MSETGLFVVATPIGNLEDISYRAVRLLSAVDLIVAEDTRHTRILCRHYDVDSPIKALHEHNEEKIVPALVERLAAGESMALVSDAGTPLISDPGYRLVRAAVENEIAVMAVPGPSAVVAALSIAGLPTDRFAFEGFLPARQSARLKTMLSLLSEPRTMVFYESSHRIQDCLADLAEIFGGLREAAVCRELTKKFETVYRGTLEEVSNMLEQHTDHRKGEFVVIISGSPGVDVDTGEAARLARLLQEHLPASQAARVAAAFTGANRRKIYELLENNAPT